MLMIICDFLDMTYIDRVTEHINRDFEYMRRIKQKLYL